MKKAGHVHLLPPVRMLPTGTPHSCRGVSPPAVTEADGGEPHLHRSGLLGQDQPTRAKGFGPRGLSTCGDVNARMEPRPGRELQIFFDVLYSLAAPFAHIRTYFSFF